jgi:hypothetical protein
MYTFVDDDRVSSLIIFKVKDLYTERRQVVLKMDNIWVCDAELKQTTELISLLSSLSDIAKDNEKIYTYAKKR